MLMWSFWNNIPGWRNCCSSHHCELFTSLATETLLLVSNSASITSQMFFCFFFCYQASCFISPIISNQSSFQSLLLCYSLCCKNPLSDESPRLGWKLYKGDVFNIYRFFFIFFCCQIQFTQVYFEEMKIHFGLFNTWIWVHDTIVTSTEHHWPLPF